MFYFMPGLMGIIMVGLVGKIAAIDDSFNEFVPGEIQHDWRVESGEAIITVPIPFPKGINQVKPDVKLEYRSNNPANRELGLGWRLAGLSEITRCAKSYALDGKFENIFYNYSDVFCLDGSRLLLVTGVYGQNGSEYRTEVDTYKRVIAFDQKGQGPSMFKVYTKDNLIYTYGAANTSILMPLNGTNMTELETASKWLLNTFEDYSGNAVRFEYTKEPNFAYLSSIKYANRVVKFAYDNSRVDVQKRFYRNLLDWQINKRLRSISIMVNGLEIKRMQLEYSQSGPANISLLASVKVCADVWNANSSSSGGGCLQPLLFDYDQTQLNQFGSTVVVGDFCGPSSDFCDMKLIQPMDMNGDGLTDLIAFGRDGVYVTLNQGSKDESGSISFGTAQKWTTDFSQTTGWDSAKHVRYVVDMNADGLPDLMGMFDNGVYVSLNQNGYFTSIQKWSDDLGYNSDMRVEKNPRWPLDVNNDGLPDILTMLGNESSGVWMSYNLNASKLAAKVSTVKEFGVDNGWGSTYPFWMVDVDGDGLKERVGFDNLGFTAGRLFETAQRANLLNPLLIYRPLSFRYTADTVYDFFGLSGGWSMSSTRLVLDMNGDNLLDLVGFRGDSKAYTAFLTPKDNGITTFNCSSFLVGPYAIAGSSTVNKLQTASDMNGDGLLDLVAFDIGGVFVGLNDGSGNTQAPTLWTTALKSSTREGRFVVDMNGDQIPDVVGIEASALANGFIAKIQLNQNRKKKLTGITDSFGNRKSIVYSTAAIEARKNNKIKESLTTTTNQAMINYTTYGLNTDLVISFTSSFGIDGYSSFNYTYGPYQCGTTQGRNSDCSFAWICSSNDESGLILLDEFYQQYPVTGLTRVKQSFYQDTLLSRKTFKFNVRKTRTGQVSPDVVLVSKRNDVFDLNGIFIKSEISEFTYDLYGNAILAVENVTDNFSMNVSRVTTSNYRNTLGTWFIGEKLYQSVINTQQSSGTTESKWVVREDFFEWSPTSRLLLKQRSQPNDPVGLEETFEYDRFGNIVLNRQSAIASNETRRRTMIYDSNGLNMIAVNNSLQQQKTYVYDAADNLVRHVDLNGQETLYTYDAFSRKIRVDFAEQTTIWSYEWDLGQTALPNSVYRVRSTIDGTIEQTVFYDALNRQIRKVKHGFSGEPICEDSEYNRMGSLVKKSLPYKAGREPPRYIKFEYDSMMREVRRVEDFVNGNTIKTEFQGLKVTKLEASGRYTINTKNLLDQVISVEDTVGSVAKYEYDVLGNLVKFVDPSGSIMTMTYNLNGQKLSKNDPATGYSMYKYNAFNELVYSRNAMSQEMRFERDALGRMTKRVEPEGTTTWIYDMNQNSIGNVGRIIVSTTSTNNSYSIGIKYDPRGLPTEKTYAYDTSATYTIRTNYDRLGRVAAQFYPTGEAVYTCYNRYGYLAAVSTGPNDFGCTNDMAVEWRALDYDAKGSIRREIYANGLINEYTFAETSQVQRVTTFSDGQFSSNYLRRIDYDYDKRQHLAQRTIYDESGRVSVMQRFAYDVLGRLVFASTFEQQQQQLQLTESLSWMYDGMGNILSFNDAGGQKVYSYNSQATKQQAVRIGNESVQYDSLGNVKSTRAYKIDWYSYSKPCTITPTTANSNPSKISFLYGADRELVGKVLGNPDSNLLSTGHFVDDLFEIWTVKNGTNTSIIEKFHVRVLGRIVSTRISTRKATSTPTGSTLRSDSVKFFYHNDAFGSIDAVSNSSGVIVLRYQHSPFGQAKLIMSNLTASVSALLNLGYAGHATIEGTRLIYMKGRIFDTQFARFLSPDPFIQDIYNIQNLNRYSYALNNPFKFNDPSGKLFGSLKKFITNPKVLTAIVVGVATAGLASTFLVPALLATAGVSSGSLAGAVIAGAVLGASSGFTTTLVMTDGNLNAALKGAAMGAVTGAISGGISNKVSNGFAEFGVTKLTDGVVNRIQKREFFDGFEISAVSFVASQYYKSAVGYEATCESGGEAAQKSLTTPPIKGANNIGIQSGVSNSFWGEGGVVSRAANKIGGLNAVAGMHDSFQIQLPDTAREILNVPLMPVAGAITYMALYKDINCPMC